MKNAWHANSKAELAKVAKDVTVTVPDRSEGRTTDHTERYCVARLLISLPSERFQFPLQLEHGDRPDFVLTMAGTKVGIEHTEAVPPNVAHASFLRAKGHGPEIYFTPHAVPGEELKTGAQLIAEIEEDETGDGWCGDSAEHEWAAAMSYVVREKLKKARLEGFTRYDKNWLLIYDNWSLPAVDIHKAMSYLKPLLEADRTHEMFDSIFVLDGRELCELENSIFVYPVIEPDQAP